MTRRPDWAIHLSIVIARWQRLPFVWGSTDCVHFASEAVEAVTGRAPMLPTDRYGDEQSARYLIASSGSLRKLVGERLGEEISRDLAAAGDVGHFIDIRGEALAVQTGGAWRAPGARGLVMVESRAILTAWRCDQWPQL